MSLNVSQVQIIDVLTQPQLAEDAGVLATPTLSYEGSQPPRRVVGDLSDLERVLAFLGFQPREKMKGKTA